MGGSVLITSTVTASEECEPFTSDVIATSAARKQSRCHCAPVFGLLGRVELGHLPDMFSRVECRPKLGCARTIGRKCHAVL